MSKSNRRQTFKRSYTSNLDIASRQSASLVIEFGAAYIRVGISGEPKPRHAFNLQSQRSNITTTGTNDCEYWASLPSLPSLIPPSSADPGSIPYDDLLPWFSNLYTHHILLKPRSRRVILLLPIHHPPELRSTLESILLDHLHVPSVLFVDSFRTIPYAIGGCGSSTGVIVDLGCVEGRLVCFFNGAICEDTLQIVPIGFQSLLDKINKSKEAMNSNSNTDNDEGMVSVKDIDAVNEMYFDLENPNSLIYAFFSSLIKCPIDLRKKVVQRIIFVGGGVEGISQFEQRFVQCVKGLFELDSDADASGDGDGRTLYRVKDDGHRRFSSLANVVMKAPLGVLYPLQFRPSCVSWVGGSIMGSIKLSDEKWINRSEQQSS